MRKLTVDLMMAVVVLVWGASYTIGKYGMQSLSPEVFTLTRFLLVIPVLLVIVKWRDGNLAIAKRDIPALLFAALVGIALYQTLFISAVKYTTATNSSLLISMAPLFTVMGAVIGRQEKLGITLLVGSVLSVLGVFLIKGLGAEAISFEEDTLFGDLLALTASLLFGLYPFTITGLSKRYSSIKLTFYTSVFGAVMLAVYCGPEWFQVDWSQLPAAAWWSLLYAAYPVTAYALVAWNYGIEVLGPSRTMPYLYLVPVTAILIAMLWLDEQMNGWQWLGAGLILFGVFLVRQGHMVVEMWRKKWSIRDEKSA
ncbi:DMT family transporter [Brevibacillus humidisoli]|uniref:DMT family transporter n=1 Tax=Brevibacillus humidisoli TaxID=2895522 RepID=UPI001E58D803|nr:DMT family transporter [Brevibacillus humidisoli]UFJ42977.1 DMT family transporter [Brevibacillus humidisoli]